MHSRGHWSADLQVSLYATHLMEKHSRENMEPNPLPGVIPSGLESCRALAKTAPMTDASAMRRRLRDKPCIFLFAFMAEIQDIPDVAIWYPQWHPRYRPGRRSGSWLILGHVIAPRPARWPRDRSVTVEFGAAGNCAHTLHWCITPMEMRNESLGFSNADREFEPPWIGVTALRIVVTV